jgi:predicted SnoaL-like aldol condensation-catalyzing enzyme
MSTSRNNREKAIAFYLSLFNDKRLDAVDEYLAESYVQHNPSVPDGRQALKEFMASFFKEYPDLKVEIVRTVAEDDLVVLHVRFSLGGGEPDEAIMDIFRFEDGKIVEHWDVIQQVPGKSLNSNGIF